MGRAGTPPGKDKQMDCTIKGTWVTFAGGSLGAQAAVVLVTKADDGWAIVTDRTPFHPVSLSWPDQPGDRGWMTLADGRRVAVSDSREGLWNAATATLADASQKRSDPDLHAIVLHVVDAAPPAVGDIVTLEVDGDYRDALSVQHTGVHLAALALNHCAARFWTKDPGDPDTLGVPNLDKMAVTGSTISPDQSTDIYRLGKSLRKKGFDREAFLADLSACGQRINDTLHGMLSTPAPVVVSPAEGPLGDRRHWSTRLNSLEAAMPCGGTHVADLARIAEITVALSGTEEGFVMTTRAVVV